MRRTTEAIVLRGLPYGEADMIVTYLTRDFGLCRAFAKSPRKLKSRFGSSLEPLTHSRISLLGKEQSTLPRLTQSDIISTNQSLREDYDCFGMLSGMVEQTMAFLHEGAPACDAFELLRSVLAFMHQRAGCHRQTALLYRARLLRLKGYAPSLSGCARCSRPAHGFYVDHGAVLCDECAQGAGGRSYGVSAGCARLYESLLEWELEKTQRLKASPKMLSELATVLDEHVRQVVSSTLRTSCA